MHTLSTPRTTDAGARGARRATPSWAAIAAWGGGLIQLALGAGAVIGQEGGPAVGIAGITLLLLGIAALGWGAGTLARGRIVLPRAGVAGALVGIVAAVTALALDPVRVSVFAVAAASALVLPVALACAAEQRRSRSGGPRRADAGGPRIVSLVLSAVLVAAVVTPALSATEAGRLAPDHADHGVLVDPVHH